VEEKKCSSCQQMLPVSEFHRKRMDGGYQTYCKGCAREAGRTYYKHKAKIQNMKKPHKWNKTNKNHYPDPEWIWTQLENGVQGEALYNKMDKKYALNTHGNSGKKHKKHTNPFAKGGKRSERRGW